jgi:hypothetical protein
MNGSTYAIREEVLHLRRANARLTAATKAALNFLKQPVRDGDRTVPLDERLGLIGGDYVSRLLSDALAGATGGPSDA